MKKNLRKSWPKNNLTILNLCTLLFYGGGFLISKYLHFDFFLNLFGFIYLIFLTPLNIIHLLKIKLDGFLEYFFASLTIFFTIFPLLYFLGNHLSSSPHSPIPILIFNLIIFWLIVNSTPKNNHKTTNHPKKKILVKIKKLFKKTFTEHWPILLIVFLYSLLHSLNYHFYTFLPEWDGYQELINIKEYLTSNQPIHSYRSFFSATIIIISQLTKIPPYLIFTKWLIFLQISLSLVVYKFILLNKDNIKKHWQHLLLLIPTLSVPVLNLEIDTTRPQNIFIILFPIYLYFTFTYLQNKEIKYWFLGALIALFGLQYHEFFLLTLLTHSGITIFSLLKKYHPKKHISSFPLFSLFLTTAFLGLIFLLQETLSSLKYLFEVLGNIAPKITSVKNWRWWFLDNYIGDSSGQQLGWPGISGAIKYYSYYLSPITLFTIIVIVFNLSAKKITPKQQPLLKLVLPLVLILLFYSELLPRFGYIYLPERMWLVIDICLLLLLPTLFVITKQHSRKIQTLVFIAIFLSSAIGIVGTIYIASQKKALINHNEYLSAQWIKENTPKHSLFISQLANGPMIKYFAERDFIFIPPDSIKKSGKLLPLLKLSSKKYDPTNWEKNLEKLDQKLPLEKYNIYFLFSENKFKGIYNQREWWLKSNYHDLNIQSLTKNHQLIYNEKDVKIWKIK